MGANLNFTVENMEFFLLVLARISAFTASAPFFNSRNIPRKVKAFFSIFVAILVFQVLEYEPLSYIGVIGYASLIIKEAIAGLLVGFMANFCTYILSLSGQMIDMEIGFSMVNEFDPSTSINTTITGNLYSNLIMLMILATYMHHYILDALIDTYQIIPVGEAAFQHDMYQIMLEGMVDYFIIGFRIILPFFAATLIVNVVLGILARISPQMNMFVIGMQLKVLVGLTIMLIAVSMLPQVADMIFGEIKKLMSLIIASMGYA